MSLENTPEASKVEHEAALLRNQGKGIQAVEKYKEARRLYEEAGEAGKAAGMQHMVGVSYKIENDLENALPALDEASKLYEAAGDPVGPGRVLRDIGIMYEYHGVLDESEEYLEKARKVLEAAPESKEKNAELGITYSKLGLLHRRIDKLDPAEKFLYKGLSLVRKAGHVPYELTTLLHFGALELQRGDPDMALTHLQATLGVIYEHDLEEEHTRRLAQTWGLMAHCYLQNDNAESARHFAKKSLDVIAGLDPNAQGPLLEDIRAEKLQKLVSG